MLLNNMVYKNNYIYGKCLVASHLAYSHTIFVPQIYYHHTVTFFDIINFAIDSVKSIWFM